MNVEKINSAIDAFKSKLKHERLSEIDWLYKKQHELQSFPILTQDNIGDWLGILFTSDRTQRMWKNEEMRSSELMLQLSTFDPDMTATSFKELFAEERDLEGRIDRFKFYMDELTSRLRRNQKSIKESHHHQNNSVISYYLSMQYPTQYCYYTHELHQLAVQLSGAKALGALEDVVRYQKMIKIFANFMLKDEELIELHQRRFERPVVEESRLIVLELLQFHKALG